MDRAIAGIVLGLAIAQAAVAGPYAPAAGLPNSTAIRYDDVRFVAWGSAVGQVVRGPQDISQSPSDPDYLGPATFGNPQTAPLGRADAFDSSTFQPLTDPNKIISLGDGGSIEILFPNPICDGPSWDFAVFENAFNSAFLELGFVEVTSDGVHWFRFRNHSLTQTTVQIDQTTSTNSIDPTDIDGLAGKYQVGWGTPFDLADLAGIVGLDVNRVISVRIVDVVGCIDPQYAQLDSDNHIINDPWRTDFATGGFDLDAIGVIHAVPEPSTLFGGLIGAGYLLGHRRRRR